MRVNREEEEEKEEEEEERREYLAPASTVRTSAPREARKGWARWRKGQRKAETGVV